MIVTIRKAEEKDYKDLMKLYNEFVGEDRYSNNDNDSFKQILNSPTANMFVAEAEGRLIGFSTCSTRFLVRYPKQIMQLDELFVVKEFRKHGVGKRLVETIEEKARDLDCFKIYIESGIKHADAHKFYEALGYENGGYYYKKTI